MDPLLVAAIGSAALAAVLKKRKPKAADEIFCPPLPPPVQSAEWVEMAKQGTALVGAGGAAAAAFIPGAGLAVSGAIALGQQMVAFGIDHIDQADTAKRNEIRDRMIGSCYGNPPGSVFRQIGRRRDLGLSAPLDDVIFVQTGRVIPSMPMSIRRSTVEAKIPVAADVKYFVTIEGPERCCAKRITPEQAAAMGHKLYTEADAVAFWGKVRARTEFRLLQRRLTAKAALDAAAKNPRGAVGTGKIGDFDVVTTRSPGYTVPHRSAVPFDVVACIAGKHHDLFCADPLNPEACQWVDSRVSCDSRNPDPRNACCPNYVPR